MSGGFAIQAVMTPFCAARGCHSSPFPPYSALAVPCAPTTTGVAILFRMAVSFVQREIVGDIKKFKGSGIQQFEHTWNVKRRNGKMTENKKHGWNRN